MHRFAPIAILLIISGCASALDEDTISRCEVDADCIYVEYDHCCTSVRAINRAYLEEYYAHPEWQGVDLSTCMDIPCVRVPFEDIDPELSFCLHDEQGIGRCQ